MHTWCRTGFEWGKRGPSSRLSCYCAAHDQLDCEGKQYRRVRSFDLVQLQILTANENNSLSLTHTGNDIAYRKNLEKSFSSGFRLFGWSRGVGSVVLSDFSRSSTILSLLNGRPALFRPALVSRDLQEVTMRFLNVVSYMDCIPGWRNGCANGLETGVRLKENLPEA